MENKLKIDGNHKIWKGKLRGKKFTGKKGKITRSEKGKEVESQNKCKSKKVER